MVADFFSGGVGLLAGLFVEDIAEGDDAEVAGEFEIGAVNPGYFVVGSVLGVVGAEVVHAWGHFEFGGWAFGQCLEKAVAGCLDIEIADNEKVAIESLAFLLFGPLFYEFYQLVDFPFPDVEARIPVAGPLGDVDGGDHEVETAGPE